MLQGPKRVVLGRESKLFVGASAKRSQSGKSPGMLVAGAGPGTCGGAAEAGVYACGCTLHRQGQHQQLLQPEQLSLRTAVCSSQPVVMQRTSVVAGMQHTLGQDYSLATAADIVLHKPFNRQTSCSRRHLRGACRLTHQERITHCCMREDAGLLAGSNACSTASKSLTHKQDSIGRTILLPGCGLLLLLVVGCPSISLVWRILSPIVSLRRLCYRLLLRSLRLQKGRGWEASYSFRAPV